MTAVQVRSLLCAAADVSDQARDVLLKLYDPKGEALIPIGPNIPPNSSVEGERYQLLVKRGWCHSFKYIEADYHTGFRY